MSVPEKATVMGKRERRAAYVSLWMMAVAFGFIEASVVVDLREVYVREMALHGPNYFAGLQVTLVSLPSRLVAVEMVREACTILLLGAVAWLAGRRTADRAGAFLLSFGVWDLTYYAALKVIAGWPDSLRAWDILFLIPLPWVAPVWAPIIVATLFVAAGSYLFWTPGRDRRYRWPDFAILAASALLTIVSFLVETRAAVDHRLPDQFPVWLFGAGVALGTAWFLRVERGAARRGETRPWADVRVRTVLPEPAQAAAYRAGPVIAAADRGASAKSDIDLVMSEYMETRRRLDELRARLILLRGAEGIEQPDEFFR